ncbi:MAG TPA: hypothetical protein VIK62_06100 [Verrucomicrobiae bacterium]
MKKLLYPSLVLIVVLTVWLCLNNQKQNAPLVPSPISAIVKLPSQQPETNFAKAMSNAVSVVVQQQTNMAESTEPINALMATNLEQWKNAVKGLKPLAGFTLNQHWLAEQPGRKIGLPITLSQEGKAVQYSAVLISVNAENNTGDIIKVEMQTPNMNIDETRTLGLKLCAMLGRDPSDFLAWCDKVGNHWLDAPLFSSHGQRMPDGNKYEGFGIYMTYNDERPWMINYFITSP